MSLLGWPVRHRNPSLALWNSSCYAATGVNKSAADHGFTFAMSEQYPTIVPGTRIF
jgi:hypothetical protein